ncbi:MULTISPECIES: YbhN family protein [Actinomycetes]|uniref:lysylphosphatidylglycerol synthase transmembrane domain-containing protein n=1 Tax=Actinomycetes TaxID=1760 RepID=UPI0004BF5705|nr:MULTISPECIES: YbhN family protein [Actinomycetes]
MTATRGARRRFWWVRWVVLALVLVVLAVEAYLVWPKLKETWVHIDDIEWEWVVLCILASMLSMDSFAQVQRALLRSAGLKIKQWQSLSVILAANSLSQTMPGGQVMAPAFTYRQTRKWGATPVVASWQVVMSGLLMGVGLAVLGLGGALLAGAKTSPFSIIFSISGFIAFALVAQYIARHPESIEGIGVTILRWINHVRDKAADHGVVRWREILVQLRAVQLKPKDTSIAFGWSLFNWVADVACLAFACYAVGGQPSIAGLMVAYAASKAVGTAIPLLPGGLGVVDGVLVPALTSAGMGAAESVTAVLVYRMVSYLLVALIGWVVIFVMFRGTYRAEDNVDLMEKEVDAQLLDSTSTDRNLGTSDPDPPVVHPSDDKPDSPDSVR